MNDFVVPATTLEMINNQSVATVALPSVEQDGILIGISWIYFWLFLIGFSGNLGVLWVNFQMRGKLESTNSINTAIFVVFLSLVDLCMVASLPLVISKIMIGMYRSLPSISPPIDKPPGAYLWFFPVD